MAGKSIADQIKEILALKEDPEGYPVNISPRTAQIALTRIPALQAIIKKERDLQIGDPEIRHTNENSITLYWHVDGKYDVLAHVKPDGRTDYYADFFDDKPIKGKFSFT